MRGLGQTHRTGRPSANRGLDLLSLSARRCTIAARMNEYCFSCQGKVFVPTSAAWPEMCPRCGAVPFASRTEVVFDFKATPTNDARALPVITVQMTEGPGNSGATLG